ncbi:MAG: hypothetical protein WAV15_01190 [Minisyncoccia bacterium]
MPQEQPNNSMISIERCKEILGEKMSDSEVERLREALYAMVESIMDNYFEGFNGKIDICKKQSFIAEYPLLSKAQKDTD